MNAHVCAAWIVRKRGEAEVMRAMLHNPNDAGEHRVPILLPNPPAEVIDVLDRITKWATYSTVYVAAEPAAITLAEPVRTILRRAIAKERMAEIEQARIERERALADPIIFVERGNAVAIIAQFGDFPIEQEVVERVIRMGAPIR